jgi:hypothetical protein
LGDVVTINGLPIDADQRRELIIDLARFAEGGILTEAQVKKRWRFSEEVWQRLGEDDGLVELIEAEKLRRIRDGSSKRERAQALVIKAPEVAASIMNNPEANAKHRLDACKVLDDFSGTAPAAAATQDRFIITINLNGDIEHFDKSIAVNPNDSSDTKTAGRVPPKVIGNKSWDDDGG